MMEIEKQWIEDAKVDVQKYTSLYNDQLQTVTVFGMNKVKDFIGIKNIPKLKM